MNMLKYRHLYFDAEANTTTSADLEPAISIDHTTRLAQNIRTLQKALGITSMKPMAAGTQVKIYDITVTKGGKQAAEGDVIPLTKAERKLKKTLTLETNLYRKQTTLQAIQKVGRNIAINETDSAVLKEVQKDVRNAFFETLTADGATSVAGGNDLQSAIASAGAGLDVAFEDMDGEAVYFLNSADYWDYMGKAPIATAQNLWGFRYVENFLDIGSAFITPRIPKGFVYATAKENLNGVYVPQGGDVAQSFDLTYDESGMVGMTHSKDTSNATVETLLASGVLFYVEKADKVIKSPISAG